MPRLNLDFTGMGLDPHQKNELNRQLRRIVSSVTEKKQAKINDCEKLFYRYGHALLCIKKSISDNDMCHVKEFIESVEGDAST